MPKNTFIPIVAFLFILICTNAVKAHLHKESYSLQSYNVSHGLSEDYIYTLLEDSKGFIWIGTRNGLNRFNGYTFERIYLNPEIQMQEQIRSLREDRDGNIWIGTNNGLFCKDNTTDQIINVTLNNKPVEVDCIFQDNSGIIWIGTNNGILYSYNLVANIVKSYSIPGKTEIVNITQKNEDLIVAFRYYGIARFNLTSNHFFYSEQDSKFENHIVEILNKLNSGSLLIGTRSGFFLQKENNSQDKIDPPNNFAKADLNGITATQINDTVVWIGTDGDGVLSINPAGNQLRKVNLKGNVPIKSVTSILRSRNGLIWLGTTNSGLHVFDPNRSLFEHWKYEKGNQTGLGGNSVLGITGLENGDICMALDGGGINIYDKNLQRFIHSYTSGIGVTNTVFQSKENKLLWIGTFGNGLKMAKINKDKHLEIINIKDNPITEKSNVKCIYEDKQGNCWVVTQPGAYKLNPSSNQEARLKKTERDFIAGQFCVILEDNNSNLWLGELDGLLKYFPGKNSIVNIKLNSYQDLQITSLAQSKGNCIWVGTKAGLFKIDQSNKDTIQYTMQHGLPSNCVNSILYDENENLWLGTDHGLVQMNIVNETFRSFGKEDGINGTNFNENSAFRGKDGRFYFGTTNGVFSFFPEKIVKNERPPDIVFTKLELFNKEIKAKDDSNILSRTLDLTPTIYLEHFQNGISIEFAAINYTNSAKNRYVYQLSGLNNKWIDLGNNRKITWNNLAPGEYTLWIKASNNDGIWNETGRKLKIIISPPWWKTWWALSIFTLLFIFILILVNKYVLRQIRLQDALKIEKIEKENQIKINDLKTQFFMNITHEFKTPLTLIIGPLERMIAGLSKNSSQKKQLIMVYKNAAQLLRLINQLMDFRKVELNKTKLDLHQLDLIHFVDEIIQPFNILSKEKQVTILFDQKPDKLSWRFDPEKLEKIIYNLLSNAIKHSPEFGTVEIKISTESNTNSNFPERINISVSDHGPGIPLDEQEAIFQRFYRLGNDSSTGTGIGLALVKSFVEMHEGIISVGSEINKGSTFNIQLPLLKVSSKETEELEPEYSGDVLKKKVVSISTSNKIPDFYIDNSIDAEHKNKILIVEDENEIREFIVEILSPYFNVKQAVNGEDGFQMAKTEFPDLIISDVIMPKTNGLELCKKIKSDNALCHIPVLLLTALSSEEEQIKGLDIGADDYISKPFNANTLIYKIKTVIENRKKIINRFKTETAMQPVDIVTHSADEELMERTIAVIKNNISNPDFKVERLIDEIGMSRSAFFRKIKAITLMAPNELIRAVRLKHSAELLIKSDLNISEICYEVGFVSPKYFRECFKRHFGIAPTKYRENST